MSHTEETKEKIRQSKLGKSRPPLSEEWRKKISESGKGVSGKYIRTPDIREKMRIARLRQEIKPEHKKIMIEALVRANKQRIGNSHHNWKGGITSSNKKIRSSRRLARWRKAVFERDDYTCVWCGARNGNGKAVLLQADHIKSFSSHPALRFEISNGRTLCFPCHKTTFTYGKRI